MIYLDHAASAPLDPRVLAAMLPVMRELHGNPASEHAAGRAALAAVEAARAQVAAMINAEAGEIIWTSGATESNNLAIKGALEFYRSRGRHLVTARTEHKSVLDACRHLETQGVKVSYLEPDRRGLVSVAQVTAALQPDTVLVSLMWVNNETGVIQDLAAIAPVVRERGVLLHVDAVQAAGRLPIDLAQLPIDLLSLSAHKLGGPKGVGALFVRRRPRARLAPQLHGGGHEQGMRSGTLPTHQLVGMGRACEIARDGIAGEAARLATLLDEFARQLGAGLPDVHLNGEGAPRAPHILNVSFGGVDGEALRAALPDLAVSSGAACSSATREPSYVLRALGRDDALAGASLRFSGGRSTSADELTQAAEQVIAAVSWLRALASGRGAAAPPPARRPPAFGYGPGIWQRFFEARAQALAGDDVLTGAAGGGTGSAQLTLQLRVGARRVQEAAFQVRGCPTTVAVAAWLAQRAGGRTLPELATLDANQIRTELEIPDERLHCALMGEDALKAALESMIPAACN